MSLLQSSEIRFAFGKRKYLVNEAAYFWVDLYTGTTIYSAICFLCTKFSDDGLVNQNRDKVIKNYL